MSNIKNDNASQFKLPCISSYNRDVHGEARKTGTLIIAKTKKRGE